MKRLIVTGGLGFIGSNLVDFLVEKGYDVFVIDNNRDSKYHNSQAKYFYNDIAEPIYNHSDIFENVDAVFHLAAEVSIQKSIQNPELFFKTNVSGTENIITYCKMYNINNFIFSSTSAVYGNFFDGSPTKENSQINCLNAYSESKYISEQKLLNNQDMNISILRYFNVYGNRQHQSGQYAPVIGNFLRQKNEGLSITIYGDGLQKRDFVNVKDVCLANYKAYIKNKKYNIYNIGSGENISVIDLAKIIGQNIVHLEGKNGEAKATLANIDKAKEVLGWTPTVFVKDYLNNIDISK